MGRSSNWFSGLSKGFMGGMRDMGEMMRADADFGMKQELFDRAKRKADEEEDADKIVGQEYARLGEERPATVETADQKLSYSNPDDAASAASTFDFTGNAAKTDRGGAVDQYDVSRNIARRFGERGWGTRSQQWHQNAEKLREEGALAAYVGLNEGIWTPEQATDYFAKYGKMRDTKISDYDSETGIADIEKPDPSNPGFTAKTQVNLHRWVGQYINPKDYAEIRAKLAKANYEEQRPDIAYAAQVEKQRIAEQNNQTRLLLAAIKGGGSGGKGSGSGKGGIGGGVDQDNRMSAAYAYYGYDGQDDLAKRVRDDIAALPDADPSKPYVNDIQSYTDVLIRGQLGSGGKVPISQMIGVAKGMALRAHGVPLNGEKDNPALRDAYKPFPEMALDSNFYTYVKDQSGNKYRISSGPVGQETLKQFGWTDDAIKAVQMQHAVSLASKDPQKLKELEARYGKDKVQALLSGKMPENTAAASQNAQAAQPAKKPQFTAEELAVAKQYGADPDFLSRNLSGALDSVKRGVSGVVNNMNENSFKSYVRQLRATKEVKSVHPQWMAEEIRKHPEYAKLLTKEELIAIQVASGKKF